MKNIFELNDEVFHHKYGKGVIEKVIGGHYLVNFADPVINTALYLPENELSFTEYNLVNGGLNHKRPSKKRPPMIDIGELGYFWDDVDSNGKPDTVTIGTLVNYYDESLYPYELADTFFKHGSLECPIELPKSKK